MKIKTIRLQKLKKNITIGLGKAHLGFFDSVLQTILFSLPRKASTGNEFFCFLAMIWIFFFIQFFFHFNFFLNFCEKDKHPALNGVQCFLFAGFSRVFLPALINMQRKMQTEANEPRRSLLPRPRPRLRHRPTNKRRCMEILSGISTPFATPICPK